MGDGLLPQMHFLSCFADSLKYPSSDLPELHKSKSELPGVAFKTFWGSAPPHMWTFCSCSDSQLSISRVCHLSPLSAGSSRELPSLLSAPMPAVLPRTPEQGGQRGRWEDSEGRLGEEEEETERMRVFEGQDDAYLMVFSRLPSPRCRRNMAWRSLQYNVPWREFGPSS